MRRSFKTFPLRVLCLVSIASALSSCALETRRSDRSTEHSKDGTVRIDRRADPSPTPVFSPPPIVTSQPAPGDQGAAALPGVSNAPLSPLPPQDTFLSKELPKIGLILGPGGLKAFAHIGVLREFARSRIPVHAVAGLEWGAMMAAFYAEKGQANDVDWKAFRLKESDLPTGGVLRGYRSRSIADFDSYLSTALPGGSAERSKIPFGCPTVAKRDKLQMLSKGSLKEMLIRCVPFPPLISAASADADYLAGAFAIEESAQWLRSQGATLIVLVNVLGAGETLSSKLAEDQFGTSVLWTEIRRELLKIRAPTVQWVVSVNTSGQKLDDFSGRKAAVDAGSRAAVDLTQKLSKQYGF